MSEDTAQSSQRAVHDTVKPTRSTIPFDERHIGDALELWMTRFGGVEDQAEEWLQDACIDSEAPTQGFAAVRGGQLLGFGIATVAQPDYVRDYIGVDVDMEPWPWTGILHILVVDERHEGEGIGSDLVWHRLQWLANVTDAEGVIGVSWHREGHRDSRPLFRKYDFEAVATVEEYYAQLDGPCPCVDCEGECRCDATLYRRPLNGGASA